MIKSSLKQMKANMYFYVLKVQGQFNTSLCCNRKTVLDSRKLPVTVLTLLVISMLKTTLFFEIYIKNAIRRHPYLYEYHFTYYNYYYVA